jgi:hypothetical protein
MEFNHKPQIQYGLMERESSDLLTEFFKELRVTLRSRPKWNKP